jgi:hypothetical protein
MDWIDVAQNRDRCLALVNEVFPDWLRFFNLSSQEDLCSME